jgi:hypothetical protein
MKREKDNLSLMSDISRLTSHIFGMKISIKIEKWPKV